MINQEELGRVLNYFYPGMSFATSETVAIDRPPIDAAYVNYTIRYTTITTGLSAEQIATVARLRDEFVASASSGQFAFGSPFAAPGASDKVTQIIGNDWNGLKNDRFEPLRALLAAKYLPLIRR